MSDNQPHTDQFNKVSSTRFSEMSRLERLKFVGKVVVFLITGGFMFPNIFSE